MEELVLPHDVVTLTGQLLLPAATRLDRETINDLARRCPVRPPPAYPFSALSDLRRDLQGFMAVPPYATIFADPGETGEILTLMGQVQLLQPVIDALDYFHEKDFHTYRHCLMVFALSTLLAKHLYPDDQRSLLGALVGPSHDLGKVCVAPEILQKRTPLTRHEASILKNHAMAGYVLLSYYTGDGEHLTGKVARDHHERHDGSGYPRGINARDEMVELVILSDIYDALISPRPYRPVSFDNRSALEELTRMATEGQIGWLALKALVAFNRRSRPDFRYCDVSLERRGVAPENNVYGLRAEETGAQNGEGGS
jgi:HD-GYP domain-containing protein (c-di-GMP phosphodiesterase class II)